MDGYAGYEKTTATLVGCWAHARRKFIEAQTAQPKGKAGKADMALSMIQKIYRLEINLKINLPMININNVRKKPSLCLSSFTVGLKKQ